MLSLAQILQLCCFSALLAGGQILFKFTAIHSPPLNTMQGLMTLPFNLWFISALILYGLATLIWTITLQNVALSVAYPFVALGFIFVPLASYFIFKEPLNWQYGVGIVLILIALKLITTGR